VFAGSWLGYVVGAAGTSVADIDAGNGDEGTDTLVQVEALSFAGVTVAAAFAVNDAPLGSDDTNAADPLVEDTDFSATGNLLVNDSDADLALGLGETVTLNGVRAGTEASGGALGAVAGATLVAGSYGALTVGPDGSYSYVLDNALPAIQALAAGATVTDSFTYAVVDAHGLSDLAQLTLTIVGTADGISGTAGRDLLVGTAGDDVMSGLGGNDSLSGGDGNDVLSGGPGGDWLSGGSGIDTASYADAGGAISVSLRDGRGSYGEAVGDRLSSIENLAGSAFDDVLTGNTAANTIHGNGGNDTIEGEGGADQLFGDAGDDAFVIFDAPMVAIIDGGIGFDTIRAGSDDTVINWAQFVGIERVSGDEYANVVISGSKTLADTIDLTGIALDGIDAIKGNGGNDTVIGSAGADTILGGAGNDTLAGGGGDDVITGGLGIDVLGGGSGADRFVFLKTDSGKTIATADRIDDFDGAEGDRIDLSAIDANTKNGATDDAFDFIGTAAFSKVAGQLHYDVLGADVFVTGDTNGDGKADFGFLLSNTSSVTVTDFLI
jgi:VCBS repeat-containing protein